MDVPVKVQEVAKGLIDMYGPSFDYLGKYEGSDFYMFVFPEDSNTGFPYVYQLENDEVLEITGFPALDIIGLFVKE